MRMKREVHLNYHIMAAFRCLMHNFHKNGVFICFLDNRKAGSPLAAGSDLLLFRKNYSFPRRPRHGHFRPNVRTAWFLLSFFDHKGKQFREHLVHLGMELNAENIGRQLDALHHLIAPG